MNKALKCIFYYLGLVSIFLYAVILFGCQKKNQVIQQEISSSDGIEKFLRHALITHSGVFTLLGAKPITGFSNLTNEPSSEKLWSIYNNFPQKVRDKHSFEEVAPHFKEEYELWSAWSGIKDEYLGKNFRFFKYPYYKDTLFFVNLDAIALVLDKYYDAFKAVVGEDFDPTEIVYSIDADDSKFWKTCFSDHYLAGLLYGFGPSNAKLFSWERQNKRPGKARGASYNGPIEVNNPSMTQLPLPSFAVFSALDKKMLFYKSMREQIIKLYEGQDFKELTFKLFKDDENSFKISRAAPQNEKK